jgi:hypothetical protein
LSRKDTFLVVSNNVSSVKNESLLSETLDFNKLILIKAGYKDYSYSDVVTGTVKSVDIRTLHSIESNYFVPKSFIEEDNYIIFRYPNKPTIYISKKDGLLYAFSNGRDEQRQAWHLLRIIGKFGYVDNFKRIQQRKQRF